MKIRFIEKKDYEKILAMNQECVEVTSSMDEKRLEKMVKESAWPLVLEDADEIIGFCLNFREQRDYDSLNYQWFEEHVDSFLYIDRIIIAKEYRHQGFGKKLYEELISYAKNHTIPAITAEINIQPPNEISLHFHEQFKFKEIAQQEISPGKIVSMQVRKI